MFNALGKDLFCVCGMHALTNGEQKKKKQHYLKQRRFLKSTNQGER